MQTVMKPYKFEDSDQVKILSFPGQFKRACDSNGVLEGLAMWLLSFFMAKSPAASLTAEVTSEKDPGDYFDRCRGVKRQERIYAYFKVANYRLSSYATKDVIAKAAADTGIFKQRPGQTAVRFAKALKDKALRCSDASPEQRTKSIFVEDLFLNVRGSMRLYWVARTTMHFRQLAQNEDTVIQLGW